MSTITSPFSVKKVVQPLAVWQFDETTVTPVGNSGYFEFPEEVQAAFMNIGYEFSIIASQKWAYEENGTLVHKGSVIETTVYPDRDLSRAVTVTHGQYVAILPNGDLTVLSAEDILD